VIEQSLFFSLGFLVAALLALAILPAFWRRAYRLTRREIEATLPLSPREIAAERDQLRAKFAVERRQLEQKMEATLASRQQELAISGGKAFAIAGLETTVLAKDALIAELNARITGVESALSASRNILAQTEQSLASTVGELDRQTNLYQALQAEHHGLSALSDQRRVEIAAYQTNLEAQRARIDELDGRLKRSQTDLKSSMDALRAAERTQRESDRDRAILSRKVESADEIAERRAAIIAERDSTIDALKDRNAQLYKAGKEMEAVLKEEQRKAGIAEQQVSERDQSISKLRSESRQIATDLSGSIEKLRADRLKLTTDLSEARSRISLLQRELNAIKRSAGAHDLRTKTVNLASAK
jgi:DNA repair exonuclease SbcCD ATPase subunit